MQCTTMVITAKYEDGKLVKVLIPHPIFHIELSSFNGGMVSVAPL